MGLVLKPEPGQSPKLQARTQPETDIYFGSPIRAKTLCGCWKSLKISTNPQVFQATKLLFIEVQKFGVIYSSNCNVKTITYPHL